MAKKINLNKKNLLIAISIVFILVGVFFAWSYWQKQLAEKRFSQIREKQQQVMLDFWRQQGLTDEEIEEKMSNPGLGQGQERPSEGLTDEERAAREEKMKEFGFNPGEVRGAFRMMH